MVSGRYRYLLDGVEVPVREEFTVIGDGPEVRVESWREAGEVRIDVEAGWVSGLLHATVAWRSPLLERRRSFEADPETSLFPLMRVFAGPVLLAARAATVVDGGVVGGGRRVLVPDVRDPADIDHLLDPLVDVRTAVTIDEAVEVEGAQRPAVRLEYRGGSYAETGAAFDVDPEGLLLGYGWDQPGAGRWQVRLTDLDGPPPRPLRWGSP